MTTSCPASTRWPWAGSSSTTTSAAAGGQRCRATSRSAGPSRWPTSRRCASAGRSTASPSPDTPGALLALLYALDHPERVERLALVSPAPAWRAARESYEARFSRRNLDPVFQEERRRLRESGLRERDPAAFQQRIFELSVAAYFHDPELARDLTPFRVTGRTQQEVWSSLGDFDLRDRLPNLRGIPSLILHGASDPIPLEASRVTAALMGAALHPVPRCGHVPYVEAHDEFVRVVGGFLRG